MAQPKAETAKDPMEDLCDFSVRTEFKDLPEEVVEFEKQDFLDTLGIAIAGSSQAAIPEVVELVKRWGGPPESRILIDGTRVSAPLAALAMGPMTRALDFGDTHDDAAHIAEYVVPTLLAVADMLKSQGKTITGKDFITAHVVSSEITGRIGRSCFWVSGGDKSGKCGGGWTFGTTAAAAKLMGLNYKTTQNALGISYSALSSSDLQMYEEGTLMVRMHHGFSAQDGIISAFLAKEAGITGPKKVLGGPRGFLATQYPNNNDPAPLTAGLGKEWDFLTILLKPYSACKFGHAPINATIDMVKEYNITAKDIAKIHVIQSPQAYWFLSKPPELKWNPKSIVDCQFSTPYVVATAAVTNKVFIDSYTEEERVRTDVRELMEKVTAAADEKMPVWASEVTITLTGGTQYTKRIDYVLGAPQNRMTWDEVITKFRGCAAYSAKQIPQENLYRVIDIVMKLEDCQDVTEIITLLTP